MSRSFCMITELIPVLQTRAKLSSTSVTGLGVCSSYCHPLLLPVLCWHSIQDTQPLLGWTGIYVCVRVHHAWSWTTREVDTEQSNCLSLSNMWLISHYLIEQVKVIQFSVSEHNNVNQTIKLYYSSLSCLYLTEVEMNYQAPCEINLMLHRQFGELHLNNPTKQLKTHITLILIVFHLNRI